MFLDIPQFGSLKVRVGDKSTGKTSRIIDDLEISSRQTKGPLKRFKRILIVRPQAAKFEHPFIIKTNHDEINIYEYAYEEENNVSVCVLDYSSEDSLFINYSNFDLYFIDDGHLYSEKIAWAIAKLVHQGKDVYFVGRRFDSEDNIYPTTLAVMLMPEVTDYKVLYNPWHPIVGRPELKLTYGPMFSTKTKKVIKKARNTKVITSLVDGKLEFLPAKILILRPKIDSLFDNKFVFTTHAGKSRDFSEKQWKHIDVAVVPFGSEPELLKTDANLIIIDEGQFFSQKLAPVSAELVRMGKHVYFTGLLHDFKDEVFPTSEAMMKLGEVTGIRKLWAQCGRCQGDLAFLSARINGDDKIVNKGQQVMVGDDKFNLEKMKYIAIHQGCKMRELGLTY